MLKILPSLLLTACVFSFNQAVSHTNIYCFLKFIYAHAISEPNVFTIYFVDVHQLEIPSDHIQPDECSEQKVIVIKTTAHGFSLNKILDRLPSRLTSTFDVIVSPFKKQTINKPNDFESIIQQNLLGIEKIFYQFLVRSTSLFIYASNFSCKKQYIKETKMTLTPATKLIMSLNPNSIGRPSFCVIMATSIKPIKVAMVTRGLLNAFDFHRSIFWNSEGAKIVGISKGKYGIFLRDRDRSKSFSCSLLPDSLDSSCSLNAMILTTVANIHNVTLIIASRAPAKASSFIHGPERIVHPYSDKTSVTELKFFEFGNAVFHYCKQAAASKSRLEFSFWLKVFPRLIRALVVSTLVIFKILLLCCDYLERKFKVQSKQKIRVKLNRLRKGVYLTYVVFCVCIIFFYANTLTTIVAITGSMQNPFEILKEMALDGYKVILPSDTSKFQNGDCNLGEFLDLYLPIIFSAHFDGIQPEKLIKHHLDRLKNGENIVSLSWQSNAIIWALKLKSALLKRGLENLYKCFQVKHDKNVMMSLWKIKTPSRYWMMKTIQRIYDSGLSNKWAEWKDWRYARKKNLQHELIRKKKLRPDYVTSVKIFKVLSIFIVLIFVAFLCEVIQIIFDRRNVYYAKILYFLKFCKTWSVCILIKIGELVYIVGYFVIKLFERFYSIVSIYLCILCKDYHGL